MFGLSSVCTSRSNLLSEIPMSDKPECLLAGLSRFQIAYQMGLERDIAPLSREAVEEGIKLLQGSKTFAEEVREDWETKIKKDAHNATLKR